MKQCYTQVRTLVILSLLFYLPLSLKSQACLCSAGVLADSLKYYASLDSAQSSATLDIPKFDPSMGNLKCLRIRDTVTSILSFDVMNRVNARFEYNMVANFTSSVFGPGGFGTTANWSATPGPYDLGAAGIDPDTIATFGPDTIFKSKIGVKQIMTVPVAYEGTGNVQFTYDLSGSAYPAPSSANYAVVVRSYGNIKMELTYFWCPLAILSSNFKGFVAAKKDDKIHLSWLTVNDEKTKQYIVEYSTNGLDFKAAGSVEGYKQSASQYNFVFPLSVTEGYMYFRVKQVDEDGKSAYSPIRKISLTNKAAIQVTSYPNPATDVVYLSFDRLISGNYKIEVVNVSGQVVYNNQSKVTNSNTLQINWRVKPAPGIYFAKVMNTTDMDQQLVRIVIR